MAASAIPGGRNANNLPVKGKGGGAGLRARDFVNDRSTGLRRAGLASLPAQDNIVFMSRPLQPTHRLLRAMLGGLLALALALTPAGLAHAAPASMAAAATMAAGMPCPHHAETDKGGSQTPAKVAAFAALCCHALSAAVPVSESARLTPALPGPELAFRSDPPAAGFAPPAPEKPPRARAI
jgi:hypothetical protein